MEILNLIVVVIFIALVFIHSSNAIKFYHDNKQAYYASMSALLAVIGWAISYYS